ncbi:MAG: uL22 family ribosomal protein [Candidatus Shikimatogenerans sp. JK-2022]|nr:uL22 family ribosomal protein [Candidatus Shikimatogenerans bostrichidophilus]
MGKRKRIKSYIIKKEKKEKDYSILKNVRISPRKIRKVIKILKGINVKHAISILDNYISFKIANILKNIIFSAISNYINKNGIINNEKLYIKNIIVNSSGKIKKIKYASQGRIHIIKKRLSLIKLEIKKNGSKG